MVVQRGRFLIHQALAFLERLAPRVAMAVVVLLLAVVLPPAMVGLYVWMSLAYGFLQSATDAAVRQVAVAAVGTNQRFLRTYSLTYMIGGPIFLGVMLAVLAAFTRENVWSLVPMLIAPVFVAISTKSVARVQLANKWRKMATGQALAAVISLGVSVPVLVLTHSLWAASIQVVLMEAVAATWVIRLSRGLTETLPLARIEGETAKVFGIMSVFSILSWAQTQGDRLAVGSIAGTSALGLYNFANATSRTVPEAIGMGSANLARAKISHGDPREVRLLLEVTARRAIILALVQAVMVVTVAVFIFPRYLGPEWAPAIAIVPVLAGSGIITAISYLVTVAFVASGKTKAGLIPKIIGVIACVPIAYAASFSLETAALLVAVRELVVLVCSVAIAKRAAPVKASIAAVLIAGIWIGLASSLPSL